MDVRKLRRQCETIQQHGIYTRLVEAVDRTPWTFCWTSWKIYLPQHMLSICYSDPKHYNVILQTLPCLNKQFWNFFQKNRTKVLYFLGMGVYSGDHNFFCQMLPTFKLSWELEYLVSFHLSQLNPCWQDATIFQKSKNYFKHVKQRHLVSKKKFRIFFSQLQVSTNKLQ